MEVEPSTCGLPMSKDNNMSLKEYIMCVQTKEREMAWRAVYQHLLQELKKKSVCDNQDHMANETLCCDINYFFKGYIFNF